MEEEINVCFVSIWKDGFVRMCVCPCVWRDLGVSVEGEMGMSVCLKDWVVHVQGEMRVSMCLERWEICRDRCVCMDREMQLGSLWV